MFRVQDIVTGSTQDIASIRVRVGVRIRVSFRVKGQGQGSESRVRVSFRVKGSLRVKVRDRGCGQLVSILNFEG